MFDIFKKITSDKVKTDEITCDIEIQKIKEVNVGKFHTQKVGKFVKQQNQTGVRIQQR